MRALRSMEAVRADWPEGSLRSLGALRATGLWGLRVILRLRGLEG